MLAFPSAPTIIIINSTNCRLHLNGKIGGRDEINLQEFRFVIRFDGDAWCCDPTSHTLLDCGSCDCGRSTGRQCRQRHLAVLMQLLMELLLLVMQMAAGRGAATTAYTTTTTASASGSNVASATATWAAAATMRLLASMVDALVVVQAVQGAEHLVAQIADRIVERLQVLLLLVPLQGQLGAQQFAAHVTAMARGQRQR